MAAKPETSQPKRGPVAFAQAETGMEMTGQDIFPRLFSRHVPEAKRPFTPFVSFDLKIPAGRRFAGLQIVIAGNEENGKGGMPRTPVVQRLHRRLAATGAGMEKITQHHQAHRPGEGDDRAEPVQIRRRHFLGNGQAGLSKSCRFAEMRIGDHDTAFGRPEKRPLRKQFQPFILTFDFHNRQR